MRDGLVDAFGSRRGRQHSSYVELFGREPVPSFWQWWRPGRVRPHRGRHLLAHLHPHRPLSRRTVGAGGRPGRRSCCTGPASAPVSNSRPMPSSVQASRGAVIRLPELAMGPSCLVPGGPSASRTASVNGARPTSLSPERRSRCRPHCAGDLIDEDPRRERHSADATGWNSALRCAAAAESAAPTARHDWVPAVPWRSPTRRTATRAMCAAHPLCRAPSRLRCPS